MVRGEVFRLPPPRRATGHEQQSPRYGVVVQADELLALSTVLVAPTSTAAGPAPWRPIIEIGGVPTKLIVEQTRTVDADRLQRRPAGRLDAAEMRAVDDALRLVLGL